MASNRYKKLHFPTTSKHAPTSEHNVTFIKDCNLMVTGGFTLTKPKQGGSLETKLHITIINMKNFKVVKTHHIPVVHESDYWRVLPVAYSAKWGELVFAYQDSYFVLSKKSNFQKCQRFALTNSKSKWTGYISSLVFIDDTGQLLITRRGSLKKAYVEELILMSLDTRQYDSFDFGFGQITSMKYLRDLRLFAISVGMGPDGALLFLLDIKRKAIVGGSFSGLRKAYIYQYLQDERLLFVINEMDNKHQLMIFQIVKAEYSLELEQKVIFDDKSKVLGGLKLDSERLACYRIAKADDSKVKLIIVDGAELNGVWYANFDKHDEKSRVHISENFIVELNHYCVVFRSLMGISSKVEGPTCKPGKKVCSMLDGKNKKRWREILMMEAPRKMKESKQIALEQPVSI